MDMEEESEEEEEEGESEGGEGDIYEEDSDHMEELSVQNQAAVSESV